MAGSVSEDNGAGRSSEGLSSGQRCQSGDSQGEWRSSEQVENGTPSTSPPYWDTDDDDDGPKPSELYGKFTWKIENFSQISKRELRSNAFEVGGYKWYILIYPQGCDVCNHLSLFLCVANHDKLLPGWSHFAQFTIAVVNKDPKKSKYSDTLHRFWKKEHDWGWKKFMELTKVVDGFIVSDTLVIKAQVQVIREKADRPFRCLDCQYRRELVRVYLSNVEKICRNFVEERRGKLGNLIEDKVRWSSFRSFWLGIDQNARRRMSREKMDAILKVVVKHFFIEKEVTSTLVMDSLYSGLKALECQSKNKKGRGKLMEIDEMPAPIVHVEKDMFVLADDVLMLLERAAAEPLPPKDDKGPQTQNRTKDAASGEEFNKDSIDREERRLTELGRRTVEIFVLAHIFSNQIEVAYQEAVALRRQEELIREEEAAGLAESELKGKRGTAEREKRTKKKQAKQKRASRKGKDRGREEKADASVQEHHHRESPSPKRNLEDLPAKKALSLLEKHDTLEEVSNVSDTGDDASVVHQPDLEERDASPINWDTDTSEIHPSTEASSSGVSCLRVHNGGADKKSPSVMDDSSSTCSTDSVPSVVTNGTYKGNSLPNHKGMMSPSRGKKQRNKDTRHQNSWGQDPCNVQLDPASDVGSLRDVAGSGRGDEPESEAFLLLKDRIQWLEQHLVEKEEEVVSLQKKLNVKDQVDVDESPKQRTAEASSSPSSPMRSTPANVQSKQAVDIAATVEPGTIRPMPSSSPSQPEKAVPQVNRSPQIPPISKPDNSNPAIPPKTSAPIEKSAVQQVSAMSRPSSAPLIPAPRPNVPVVSMVQTAPSLSRSVSAAGRLGTDPLPVTHGYIPPSYRNAITGRAVGATSSTLISRPSSSSASPAPSYSQPPALGSAAMLSTPNSTRKEQIRSGFTFGNVMTGLLHSQQQWIEHSQHEANGMVCGPSLLNDITGNEIRGSSSGGSQASSFYANEVRGGASAHHSLGTSSRQSQGTSADEFPHLDIINYLLDEEQGTAKSGEVSSSSNNGHNPPTFIRQFTFPGDAVSSDVGSSINSCRFDRAPRYPDDGLDKIYSSPNRPYGGLREVGGAQVGLSSYANGQMDGMIQNQWPGDGADLSLLGRRTIEGDGYPVQLPDYSNLSCGVNGFGLFRPANGH